MKNLLRRMFGCPEGLPGRLGGFIMSRTNNACGAWVASLLAIKPDDRVLEVGFGPGVTVRRLAELAPAGLVAGADVSREMVAQARRRNAEAIRSGQVALHEASAEHLPFDDGSFDKALAINSLQVWPDALAGLREIGRVLRGGGRIGFGFTPYAGQQREGLAEQLIAAGFRQPSLQVKDENFCMLATKP